MDRQRLWPCKSACVCKASSSRPTLEHGYQKNRVGKVFYAATNPTFKRASTSVLQENKKQRPNHERSKARNLRCCKHRLESIQRPTGRTCLFFVPTVQTAVQISHTHHGQQVSKDAIEWVHQLNDGGESSVACGMVADGVDEGMRFTRGIESEMADKAKVHYEVKYFLCRIDGLFGKRGCLKSGYIKMMLDIYKKNDCLPSSNQGRCCHWQRQRCPTTSVGFSVATHVHLGCRLQGAGSSRIPRLFNHKCFMCA